VTGAVGQTLGRGIGLALRALADYLLEAAPERCRGAAQADPPAVAVIAVGHEAGATTVARGLGAALAAGVDCRAAVVWSQDERPGSGRPGAGRRLAREIGLAGSGQARATGSLLLAGDCDPAGLRERCRRLAPLMFDVGHGRSPAVPAALADAVLLVAAPPVEPALAIAVADSLGRIGPRPAVVLNRAEGEIGDWEGRCDLVLPHAALGAKLARAGLPSAGALAHALGRLLTAVN
jgi:hypothetical protein